MVSIRPTLTLAFATRSPVTALRTVPVIAPPGSRVKSMPPITWFAVTVTAVHCFISSHDLRRVRSPAGTLSKNCGTRPSGLRLAVRT
jgi:hypothetical protein